MIVTAVCSAQTEAALHNVSLIKGDRQPVAGLVLDSSGIPYGTAEQGMGRSSNGKPATNWSNLPPDAQHAILAALEPGDPWTQQPELVASDGQAQDGFGVVAVSGNTIVVGAPVHPYSPPNEGPGAAYVFVKSGGTWSQKAELTASDGVSGDLFGDSIAVDGNTIVVGAPIHQLGLNQYPGAAYVFVESGGTWTQQAELTASDGASWDNFGNSVAISGTTIVVGAVYHKALGLNQHGPGAAYVFVGNGGTWSQQAELTASDGFDYDLFGTSVAISGSTAFVGAPRHTVGTNVSEGVAYVFAPSGTAWSQQAELTASEGTANDYFGWSVAVSGNTAVVGAPLREAVYVFGGTGTTWSEQAELTVSDGTQNDSFGSSVAVSGITIVAGAPNQNVSQGVAYVFTQSGGTWSQQAKLTASDGAATDGFGSSVGVSNGVAVAGAGGHKVSSNSAQGAAYVFVSPMVALSPTSLSFGNQAINTTSTARGVTVTNSGNATLDISSINASVYFTVSSKSCGATLAVGKTCRVSVTFTPAQLGQVRGTLSFTDDAVGSPETVPLLGTGVLPATLTPAKAACGTQAVGTISAPKIFTLANNQAVALTSLAISTTGDFALSATTCGASLAAKSKCTISVTFTPTEIGKRTGQLVANDSANNSPQTSNLAGTGK